MLLSLIILYVLTLIYLSIVERFRKDRKSTRLNSSYT